MYAVFPSLKTIHHKKKQSFTSVEKKTLFQSHIDTFAYKLQKQTCSNIATSTLIYVCIS